MEEREENAIRLALFWVLQALMDRDKSLAPMMKMFMRRGRGGS